MTEFINKYATAITTALFTAMAASGIAMFFHLGKHAVEGMHEWLGMVLVLAAGFHVFKNWPAMVGYFRRKTIYLPLALTIVAAVAFIVPASLERGGGGNPARALMQAMQTAKLADVSKVLEISPADLEAALKKQGFTIESSDARLSEIARASGKPPMAALTTALDAARK